MSEKAAAEIKQLIIETLKKQKPETTEELIKLVQATAAVPSKEITKLLIELENEDKVHFEKRALSSSPFAKAYLSSKKAVWYWITISLALATCTTVFLIPDSDSPIIYLRYALSIIFLLFLSGYSFINLLFPLTAPIADSNEHMDKTQRVVLSLVMSLVIMIIVGLVLNYTPWGITLTPITLSLLALTVTFATAAIIREHQTKVAT